MPEHYHIIRAETPNNAITRFTYSGPISTAPAVGEIFRALTKYLRERVRAADPQLSYALDSYNAATLLPIIDAVIVTGADSDVTTVISYRITRAQGRPAIRTCIDCQGFSTDPMVPVLSDPAVA